MIIVIGGIKGGTGKTTIATNIVAMRSQSQKVLFIDADELGGSFEWVEHRKSLNIPTSWTTIQLSGKHIHQEIEKLHKNYEDIIIDAGGRDTTSQRSCLVIADLLVIPFRPRTPDIWTLDRMDEIVSDAKKSNPKLKCLAVINQADSQGKDNQDAKDILSECKSFIVSPTTIGLRKSFHNAFSQGLGICEFKKSSTIAKQEMKDLYSTLFIL